jgi:phosphatidylinositol alpha-1,6-mannosyltransferase
MKTLKQENNVLLFTLEYPPQVGGIANYYGNLIKYWPSYAKASDGKSEGVIKVLSGKKLLKPHWLFGLFYLWRTIKKNNIQTVLVGQILPLGTVAWVLSRVLGIKFDYVVFLHGMDLTYALKVPRKKKLARKILTGAKKVIAANSYTAKLAGEIVDGGKIEVVNPGINLPITNYELRITNNLKERYDLENKIVLLQVGRLVKRKGADKVLETLPNVLAQYPNIVYIVVGNGEMLEDLRLKTYDLKLNNNVILITKADDEELNAWYELCDMFIMPARNIDGDFEGFGIVYLEANAHGKPVIAGDSGGVRDAVVDGVNGSLVNPESTEEIAQAIIKLAKDENLRKKLGEQGREWVRKFDWQEQVSKFVKSIKSESL